ncbi:hypothetical protein PV05_05705 [Exophiala xenobiotica]|uniref:Uncharacterized protein n=1 Tax=Exophiala xenobiotica TaxID=348802 RepID=A0A0D2BXG4_9EURO|nr:uncharacterized protein PV05_05705 [Exophiala xenobiotica]KIW57106.1 hypothetical protein PV05_05705 [Exophiala xenobiotica]
MVNAPATQIDFVYVGLYMRSSRNSFSMIAPTSTLNKQQVATYPEQKTSSLADSIRKHIGSHHVVDGKDKQGVRYRNLLGVRPGNCEETKSVPVTTIPFWTRLTASRSF